MRLPKAWLLALLVLPALQGCGQKSQAGAPADPPIVTVPAEKITPPAGPVMDAARIMKPVSESNLKAHLSDYWRQTGNALVVVSVTSLQGRPIEPFATALFNNLGIGDKKTNRGLLILVAPNERKVRIEVGCGLEAAISNAVAGQIIEQDIIPSFKNGDFDAGILAGVDALEKRLAATKARGPTSDACKKIMGLVAS